MQLQEGDELTLGGHYWMPDDTGDDVWRLAEVLERGEGGNVSVKLESGGVIDIDPVSWRVGDIREESKPTYVSWTAAVTTSLSLWRFRLLSIIASSGTAVSVLCGRRLLCGACFQDAVGLCWAACWRERAGGQHVLELDYMQQ